MQWWVIQFLVKNNLYPNKVFHYSKLIVLAEFQKRLSLTKTTVTAARILAFTVQFETSPKNKNNLSPI